MNGTDFAVTVVILSAIVGGGMLAYGVFKVLIYLTGDGEIKGER